ncbi:glycoside hydrolase family 97 C-terminal domain-containing protein [Novosphingobium endophyticum]|nr:glycoside hydrolase family 97 C-terminal domain-containing protein [Novosphingobium endophyticum]
MTVYADEGAASEPRETKVRIEKRDVTVRDAMTMRLAPSGGQAVLFERT